MITELQYVPYALMLIAVTVLCILIVLQWKHHKNELSEIHAKLDRSEGEIKATNDRLFAVFQISQKFVEAESEGDIISELLSLTVDFTGAIGASYVPFDSHGQPMVAKSLGSFPFPVPHAWLEYMASPAVRSECMNCTQHESVVKTCPLFKGPFSEAMGLYCLPLRRGNREYGILNLYLPDTSRLDDSTRLFIGSLMDATSMSIEAVRLRKGERETLNQLRAAQQPDDSNLLLHDLLETACELAGADFGIYIPVANAHVDVQHIIQTDKLIACGEIPEYMLEQLNKVAHRSFTGDEDILEEIKWYDENNTLHMYHVLGMPVLGSKYSTKGVVLIAREGMGPFHDVHKNALVTIASQIGLVLHLSDQLSEITYKIMMDERIRLAREIHDGLAQTLGFLKLLAAQMQGYIDQKDFERIDRLARTFSQTVSDAYQDVREAIDGLRVMPLDELGNPGSELSWWLEQTIKEFRENQDIHSLVVSLEKDDLKLNLSSEVQAQLIRIIQEALSNVRKHAQASQVIISFRKSEDDLIIEIRDNGIGFSPEQVPGPSQHGLRGMRERTELIGADFQIIGFAGAGTTVRISLPHSICEQVEKDL